jgi:hypothetical protein
MRCRIISACGRYFGAGTFQRCPSRVLAVRANEEQHARRSVVGSGDCCRFSDGDEGS